MSLPDPILRITLEYSFKNIWTDIVYELTLFEFVRCLEIFNVTKQICINNQMIHLICIHKKLNIAEYLQQTYDIIKSDIINSHFNGLTIQFICSCCGLEAVIWL